MSGQVLELVVFVAAAVGLPISVGDALAFQELEGFVAEGAARSPDYEDAFVVSYLLFDGHLLIDAVFGTV